MRPLTLLVALALAACSAHVAPVVAPVIVRATPALPTLVVESPVARAFLREPEVDVRGHFTSPDGRGWIFVEGTAAEITGDRFVARRVPLREGQMDLKVDLADGLGRKLRTIVPVVVENADRPRTHRVCDAGRCLAVEVRGVPRRDADARIVNAVVVLSAFGFSEKLDELWPGLIGPSRPLDPRHQLVLGVAPLRDEAGVAPRASEVPALLGKLFADEQLGPHTVVVGASSFGAELVLQALAAGTIGDGPVVVCGGHDRPYTEPAMQAVRAEVERARKSGVTAEAAWRAIARVMVPASYSAAYLADATHATEHGLVEEARKLGFAGALTARMAEVWARAMTIEQLSARLDDAFVLAAHPLRWPSLAGRRVVLVGNERDRMMSLPAIRATATRLQAAGAQVDVRSFDDELGHSAFFQRVPAVLARALLDVTRPVDAPPSQDKALP